MRVGIMGLASRHWPAAFARCARQIKGVELCAAADLGRTSAELQATLGMDAAAFAERFGVRPYHAPEEMIADTPRHADTTSGNTASSVATS